MLQVHYSNRTERLLDAFCTEVARRREQGISALEPIHLVVPNRNVETYVKLGLAARLGIAANVQVHMLRRFLGNLARSSSPPVRIVDADALLGMLLGILLDEEKLAHPDLADVRRYLSSGGEGAPARHLRACQMASRLARLFEEYGYARHDWLTSWRTRPVLKDTALSSLETWQRRLYLMMTGEDGVLARRGETRWTTLGAVFSSTETLAAPREAHLFGISYVGRALMEVLARLATVSRIQVYTLNPCREFWEDVRTLKEDARDPLRLDESEDPFGLMGGAHPEALRQWGRPGRENVRLLNELTQCEFEDHFPDEETFPKTLLGRLQRDIMLLRTADPSDERLPADGSVQMLACPSVRREAETIAAEVWQLVRADPSLRFNEVAVMVNSRQKDAYLTQLAAVFDEAQHLPCTVVDLPAGAANGCVQAVEMLLDLPLGELTRQQVLDFVLHPSAMGVCPDASREAWVAQVDRLGIFHGADHKDHEGTYVDGDLFNWDQGLRRMALGVFLSGPRSGDETPFTHAGVTCLPEELAPAEIDVAGRLALLLRSLVADVVQLRHAELQPSQWADLLGHLVTTYLHADTPEDERSRARCLQALRFFDELDTDGKRLPYAIVRGLVKEALASLGGSVGQHLAEGVVLSSLAPMRALPFKVIFLAGLGEGLFPAADDRDPLDLRRARRRAGDVTAREQDRYMFLETLLCARERLYLSYVSRDALTGDALTPSAVLQELAAMLRAGYLDEGARLERKVPLRRHEDVALIRRDGQSPFPEAVEEARALKLREEALAVLGDGARVLPPLEQCKGRFAPQLSMWLGLPAVPEGAARAKQRRETLQVPLFAVRSFLECALQGYARFVLDLDEDDDDRGILESEPFSFPVISVSSLLRDVFLRSWPDPQSLPATYDEAISRLRLRGQAPVGFFAAAERGLHEGVMRTWRESVDTAAGVPVEPKPVRLGSGLSGATVEDVVPELVLEVQSARQGAVRVLLRGRTVPLDEKAALAVMLKATRQERGRSPAWRMKMLMRMFVDHAVICAAGTRPIGPWRFLVVEADRDGKDETVADVAPLHAAVARQWLTDVVTDLLNGPHAYFMPCEAVFAHEAGGDLRVAIDALRGGEGHASFYGPVARADRYAAPPDPEAIVARRHRLFLNTVRPRPRREAEDE